MSHRGSKYSSARMVRAEDPEYKLFKTKIFDQEILGVRKELEQLKQGKNKDYIEGVKLLEKEYEDQLFKTNHHATVMLEDAQEEYELLLAEATEKREKDLQHLRMKLQSEFELQQERLSNDNGLSDANIKSELSKGVGIRYTTEQRKRPLRSKRNGERHRPHKFDDGASSKKRSKKVVADRQSFRLKPDLLDWEINEDLTALTNKTSSRQRKPRNLEIE